MNLIRLDYRRSDGRPERTAEIEPIMNSPMTITILNCEHLRGIKLQIIPPEPSESGDDINYSVVGYYSNRGIYMSKLISFGRVLCMLKTKTETVQ